MNRLWIRISFAIMGIILFLVIVPLAFSIGRQNFDFDDSRRGQDDNGTWIERIFFIQSESDDSGNDDGKNEAEENDDDLYALVPGYLVLRSVVQTLAGVTVISILAGIVLSKSLIKPLDNLVTGARALARRDLSQRIAVKGSTEMQAVARAFNEMAGELETAETQRRNLLADVAHELRTPLTVLQGNLRAILDDVYELDKAEVARLYDQTRHLTRLVNDLRELAQAESQQLALNVGLVDVDALVKDATANFAPMTEDHQINLEIQLPQGLPSIFGDAVRLTQCMHNLIDNAIRHTPSGGAIHILVRPAGHLIEIEVRDDGEGIAPEHLTHVFDRFYRPAQARERETGGTGLGLAIVKAIVELHNGQVHVQSGGLGMGASFTIMLPIKAIKKGSTPPPKLAS